MLNTLRAIIREGRIELLENLEVPDGTKALVTILPDEDETAFWMATGQASLNQVWDNAEDDIYAELLKK